MTVSAVPQPFPASENAQMGRRRSKAGKTPGRFSKICNSRTITTSAALTTAVLTVPLRLGPSRNCRLYGRTLGGSVAKVACPNGRRLSASNRQRFNFLQLRRRLDTVYTNTDCHSRRSAISPRGVGQLRNRFRRK
jgi:hypothetical protein